MDPLSITAGVLALLGAARKTFQGLEKLLALKDAPRELVVIVNEVSRSSSVTHCSWHLT